MKGLKVLITGGAGFLGTNLAQRLIKEGSKVVLIDDLSRRGVEGNLAYLKKLSPKLKHYQAEINDAAPIIVKEKPDLIYHFAAQVAVTTSVVSPLQDFRINAEGTFTVARTAGTYGIPVIYTSTNKVYGDNVNNVPIKELKTRYDFAGRIARKGIDEQFPIDAAHHTPYGCSKLAGELYVREFGGVVNRCSCMYGEHQYGVIDQGWVSFFITQKLLGKPITIFGDGKQIRDLLFADDMVELLVRQGKRLLDPRKGDIRGEVFSIGGGYKNTISLLELCNVLELEKRFGEWRPADQKVYYADTAKAKRMLGWEPKVSAKEGIQRTLDWTRQFLESR